MGIADGELMPEWLSMVSGVVDVVDLRPNMSFSTLFQNKTLQVIKSNLVNKCLELFAEIAERKDDYNIFQDLFGKRLALGMHEDPTTRMKIAELMKSGRSTLTECE